MWLGTLPLDSVHLGLNPSCATAVCPLGKLLTFSKLYFFIFGLRTIIVPISLGCCAKSMGL